ncbi:hypothetical protein WICPIJ_008119 [Wickerhamomyces pijperi]|nr:hypothetical protein WICPIJ_008119 [Wickerhamomyces pijperi]
MRELIAQNMKTGVIDKSFTFHDEEALDLYVDNLFGTELYPNWSHATAGFESLDVSMEDLMMKVQPDGTQGREADIIGNIYGSKPSDVNFDSYDFQTFF